jgi:maltoporin
MKTGLNIAVRGMVLLGLMNATAVQAAEWNGIEVSGYGRSGDYASQAGMPRGGYTLGGDMQKFRLGNEGDHGGELGLGKAVEMSGGKKLHLFYMPSTWGGQYSTAQAYVAVTGLDFAPEAKVWAGQRRLRLQEVHIVDRFMLDYGDNLGAGITDYNLGFAKMGLGLFSSGTVDNSGKAANNANRVNLDLSEINVNQGGALRVLATMVRGNFQMGAQGMGLSLAHTQSDFLAAGLSNTFYLQTATGHAAIGGQFRAMGDVATGGVEQPGARSWRVADAINWQRGAFGGQAIAGYQSARVDGGVNNGLTTRDVSLGGRVSYAMTQNFKLLGEAGVTSRSVDGQAVQRLNKLTIAPTLALAPDFWSRPELRFYVTRANWNSAATLANAGAGGFGVTGKTASTIAGMQLEAWW